MPLAPTDFIFSEDQALILHTASEFAHQELLPLDLACDVDESSVTAILSEDRSRLGSTVKRIGSHSVLPSITGV